MVVTAAPTRSQQAQENLSNEFFLVGHQLAGIALMSKGTSEKQRRTTHLKQDGLNKPHTWSLNTSVPRKDSFAPPWRMTK